MQVLGTSQGEAELEDANGCSPWHGKQVLSNIPDFIL